MISANSIRYSSREPIKDASDQSPLTVLELRDFLNRIILGQCGSFTVIGLNFVATVLELNDFSDNLIVGMCSDRLIIGEKQQRITHYTLDGINKKLLLD